MYRMLQVGCGPTGTSMLRQLLPRLADSGIPALYEVADPALMGPGLAFSTPYDQHLLNVRADRMSLHPDDKREFARWRLREAPRWTADFPDSAPGWHDYPPRRLFGMYARDVLDDALRATEQRVELTRDRVVAVRRDGDGRWRCRFSSGRAATYDRVVLTLGHLPSARYSAHDDRPAFLRDPWGGGLDLPGRLRVGVIGTRLTGVDVALALRERGHTGPVLLASRSGWLPSVKGTVTAYELAHLPGFVAERRGQEGMTSLRAVAQAIAREVQDAEGTPVRWADALCPPASSADTLRAELTIAESGRPVGWQSVLGAVVPWVPALWGLLDSPGRELLMSTYIGIWAVRIASFPAVSARRLLEMIDDGRLAVRSGLTGVRPSGAGHLMCFSDGGTVPVDVVVNATGPGYGRGSLEASELTRDLLRSGTAAIHRFGGIAVDEQTFEARGADGANAPGLHVTGDLTRGVWLATNAVENTVRQSMQLAEVIRRGLVSGSCRSRPGADT
jgi:uncharacterized NAD(P)/FAD-binding protein YdhS